MRWYTIILLTIPLCCAEPQNEDLHPINRNHNTCRMTGFSFFRKGCDWCTCVRGRVFCTPNKICSADDPEQPRCRGQEIVWYEQCNECICNGERNARACTKKNCPKNPKRHRRSNELNRVEVNCQAEHPNAWWRNGCVFCQCSAGVILCSREECRSDRVPEPQVECLGDAQWRKDHCNTCSCKQGTIVCTQRICTSDPSPSFSISSSSSTSSVEPECLEGRTTKNDCNECVCISGRRVCTRRLCAPAPHPEHLTVCDLPTHLKKNDGCRALVHRWTYQSVSKDCVETIYTGCGGSENLFTDINSCRQVCGFHNRNSTRADGGCEEGTVEKRDCNTCVCREGRRYCTDRYCSNNLPVTTDVCLQPPIFNPIIICHAHFSVWSYDRVSQECRRIRIQGCTETKNVFPDQQTCKKTCRHLGLRDNTEVGSTKDPRCLRRPLDGDCPRVLEPRYLFNPQTGRCQRTYTSSCGALIQASFASLEACQFTCDR